MSTLKIKDGFPEWVKGYWEDDGMDWPESRVNRAARHGREEAVRKVKPVFDKMLGALRRMKTDGDFLGWDFPDQKVIVDQALKEAEELGL